MRSVSPGRLARGVVCRVAAPWCPVAAAVNILGLLEPWAPTLPPPNRGLWWGKQGGRRWENSA
jgi:hypothetical protein